MLACHPLWLTLLQMTVPATIGAWLAVRQLQRDFHKGD